MKNLIKKISFTFAMILTVIFSLTACSSGQEKEINVENTTISMESLSEAIVEEPETSTITDITIESESEVTPTDNTLKLSKPVVYEGIDYESDLPGVEWFDSFVGIIDEPKMVILNDNTNKKMIVENGATVEFAMDDLFAIWVPDKTKGVSYNIDDLFSCKGLPEYYEEKYFLDNPEYFIFKDWGCYFAYDIFPPTHKSGDIVDIKNTLTYDDGSTIELTATLVLK